MGLPHRFPVFRIWEASKLRLIVLFFAPSSKRIRIDFKAVRRLHLCGQSPESSARSSVVRVVTIGVRPGGRHDSHFAFEDTHFTGSRARVAGNGVAVINHEPPEHRIKRSRFLHFNTKTRAATPNRLLFSTINGDKIVEVNTLYSERHGVPMRSLGPPRKIFPRASRFVAS